MCKSDNTPINVTRENNDACKYVTRAILRCYPLLLAYVKHFDFQYKTICAKLIQPKLNIFLSSFANYMSKILACVLYLSHN